MVNVQFSLTFATLFVVSQSRQIVPLRSAATPANATSGASVEATQLSECFGRRPVRNLVYRYEGIVDQNPGFRAGCEVKYRSYGSTGFNPDLNSQREELEDQDVGFSDSPIVLKYFVINPQGEEQIVPLRGITTLKIPGESHSRNLTWDQFCFPKTCQNFIIFLHTCLLPFHEEGTQAGNILAGFAFYPVDRTMYRFGLVSQYSTYLYCHPKDQLQRVPLLTAASPSYPVSKIKTLHTHDNLTFDLGPHLSYTYWMNYAAKDSHFESIGCLFRTPVDTPGQVYRTFVSRRHYEEDPKEFVPTSQAFYGINATQVSSSGEVDKISNVCFPSICFPEKTEASRCDASLKTDFSPTRHEIHLKYQEDGYSPYLHYRRGRPKYCETRTVVVTRPHDNTNSTQLQHEEHFTCNTMTH